MNHRSLVAVSFAVALPFVSVAQVAAAAPSEGNVECSNAQFADHLEAGQPVGDAASIGAAKKAVYWVDVANPGAPTQLTLVWSLDGKEVQRQLLDVGTSKHWHTWGMRPLGNAQAIRVQLLGEGGSVLKEDSLALAPASAPPHPAS